MLNCFWKRKRNKNNITDRANCNFKDKDGKNQLAHTLNGSLLALPRVLRGILEKYQTAEGIVIPEVLRSYCGVDIIN